MSAVVAYQPAADTYTAQATVGDVVKGVNNHKVPSSYASS